MNKSFKSMAMLSFKSALFIILFAIATYCSKLNVPRVLLPVFDDFTVSFNIEVTDGGCYKWFVCRFYAYNLVGT